MQRVASWLKVRPEEGQLVLLVGILFLCIQAGQGLGDNAASALFFLRFGVDNLPYMYLILGGTTFMLTLAYTAGLGRFERRHFFQSLILGLILLLLIERVLLGRPFLLLYPILWLTISCMGMILGTFTWNLAGEVSDTRQAKRWFPLFASAGILGSVLGNSITGAAARLLGTDNLLVFYAGLLGLIYYLSRVIAKNYLHPGKSSAGNPSLWGDLRAGFDFVRGSQLMTLVAYASVLFSVLFFSISFPFNKVVTNSFPDEASVAGFLGLFSSITTAVTFTVSLLLANRIYARLGIVNSVFLMPLIYVFCFIVFASQYSLTGAIIARFSQLVILSGIAGTAWNALFNVVPSQKRSQVLAFNNGVPSQIGVALSGLLIILGDRVLTTTQIFLMGMLVALICGFLVWRMRAAYGQALIDALSAGRLEVFNSDEPAFAGLEKDAAALDVVTRALQDARPTTRRIAAEILGKMQAVSAIPALTRLISDENVDVRTAVVRALGELQATSAINMILMALDDPDSVVRRQALVSLAQLEPPVSAIPLTKLEHLLDDPSTNIRIQAAFVLAKVGEGERAIPSLMSWLNDGELLLRISSLETFGRLAEYMDDRLDPKPVYSALQDPLMVVRQAACCALAGFKDAASFQALVTCLYDTHAEVRNAASESLRSHGTEASPFILKIFDSDNSLAQDAALNAISPGSPQVLDRLRVYAREEIVRLRSLRSQLVSLPENGPAVIFLRESLEEQLNLGENRLVKIVGLIGNPRAMDLVQKNIHKSDPESRAASLEALETLGDKQFTRDIIAFLEEAPEHWPQSNVIETVLKNKDRWMRALSVRVIQELGLREFIPKLLEFRSSPDALIREAALEALIQFGEVKSMETLQTVSMLERVLLLREVPIFADLSPEDLQQIAEIAREQWYPNDTSIFRQGEEGNMMFVIVSGQVQVVRSVNGIDRILAERSPGDFVGEMAILESAPRSATLRTKGEVRMLVIGGDAFKEILRERSAVSLAVLQNVSRRLREMIEQRREE